MSTYALVVAAYLLGSICFGPIVARAKGVDLRASGSGNVGATNVGRLLGRPLGRLVLVLDAAKGVIAVAGARALGAPPSVLFGVTLAVVLGHVLPVFERFRGGKGAATAVGALLALDPVIGALAAATYVGVKRATGFASAGTLAGCAVAGVVAPIARGVSWETAAVWAVGLVVLARHHENVRRLVRGEELPS